MFLALGDSICMLKLNRFGFNLGLGELEMLQIQSNSDSP